VTGSCEHSNESSGSLKEEPLSAYLERLCAVELALWLVSSLGLRSWGLDNFPGFNWAT
jgi:hypothetical protein